MQIKIGSFNHNEKEATQAIVMTYNELVHYLSDVIRAWAQYYCRVLKNVNENKGHIRDRTIQNSRNLKGQDYSQFRSVPYKINCV